MALFRNRTNTARFVKAERQDMTVIKSHKLFWLGTTKESKSASSLAGAGLIFYAYFMNDALQKVECRTPTSGRDGVTRIPAWKYDIVRAAIIETFAQSQEAQVKFSELRTQAKDYIPEDKLAELGSWGWHFTTVKLNMEVKGELMRVVDATPQRLSLTL